jgi:uncharacterized protein (DUF1800 family)
MTVRLDRRGFLGGAVSLSAILSMPQIARAAQAMGFDEARHLLSRASFGATPTEIQSFASLDYGEAIDRLLANPRREAITPAPRWVNEGLKAVREEQREAVEKLRAAGNDKKQAAGIVRPIQEQGRELRNWWVEEMLVTDQPLIERMTLFWHNHFTSSFRRCVSLPRSISRTRCFGARRWATSRPC